MLRAQPRPAPRVRTPAPADPAARRRAGRRTAVCDRGGRARLRAGHRSRDRGAAGLAQGHRLSGARQALIDRGAGAAAGRGRGPPGPGCRKSRKGRADRGRHRRGDHPSPRWFIFRSSPGWPPSVGRAVQSQIRGPPARNPNVASEPRAGQLRLRQGHEADPMGVLADGPAATTPSSATRRRAGRAWSRFYAGPGRPGGVVAETCITRYNPDGFRWTACRVAARGHQQHHSAGPRSPAATASRWFSPDWRATRTTASSTTGSSAIVTHAGFPSQLR